MHIKLSARPRPGPPPQLLYSWDENSSVLGVRLTHPGESRSDALNTAPAEVLEIAGTDGSWLFLEADASRRLTALEIAVWPDLTQATLSPRAPHACDDVRLITQTSRDPLARFPSPIAISGRVDPNLRAVHLSFGRIRPIRLARLASSVHLELDASGRLAGLWLLDVPALPSPQAEETESATTQPWSRC